MLKTTFSKFKTTKLTTIIFKDKIEAVMVESQFSWANLFKKKTNKETRQTETISKNQAFIVFAVGMSVKYSTGIEYKTAGGETSETKVKTLKYVQSLGLSG